MAHTIVTAARIAARNIVVCIEGVPWEIVLVAWGEGQG